MNKNIQKGATLIELIIAISIVAVALFGVISVFRVTVTNSANPITQKQAVLIAESVMDEVLSKSFTTPSGGYAGPFINANRDKFDSINDYNNLSITTMTSISGTTIGGLEKYSATINTANVALGTLANSESIVITINVVGPNDNFTLKGYRVNYDN
jgi:MSHA pilin protein MshD